MSKIPVGEGLEFPDGSKQDTAGVQPESVRGFWYSNSSGAVASNDGTTLEKPKPSIQSAIDAAVALSPIPGLGNEATVKEGQGGVYSEDVTLADSVLVEGRQTSLNSPGLVCVSGASFMSFNIQTIDGLSDYATGLKIDGSSSFGAQLSALLMRGEDAKGINITGSNNSLFLTVSQLALLGDASVGIDVSGSSITPIDININTHQFGNTNQTFLNYNPSTPETILNLAITSVFDQSVGGIAGNFAGTKAFHCQGGVLNINAETVSAKTAVDVSAGAVCTVIANVMIGNTVSAGGLIYDSVGFIQGNINTTGAGTVQVRSSQAIGNVTTSGTGGAGIKCDFLDGDLVVGAGTRVYVDIDQHTGTITNNGTLDGIINGVRYGNAEIMTDATIDGDGSTGSPLSVSGSLSGYQLRSEKGAANGYAGLDSGGKVPNTQLPDYVDQTEFTDANIKIKYENNANTNGFTDAEKSKLAGLDSSKFLGEFVSLPALEAAFPSPVAGSYANVDAGVGNDVVRYIWDSDDLKYVLQLGESTELTDAQIKTQYENNPDTNAFTDTEKSKLGGIEAGAQVNQSNAQIKAQYEANPDTNTFTDSDVINLGNQSGTNTGDQTLPANTDDISEASNLYYTESRVSANASVTANTAKVSFPEAPQDGNQYARKDAGWEQVAADLGYILATWGANLQTLGRHPAVNGAANTPEITSLGISASAPVPAAGTIDTLTYYNSTGDNTTVFQIIKNGVVMHTFTCTGPYGVETGINVPTGFVGTVPDNIAIRYASGTAPGEGFCSIYIS